MKRLYLLIFIPFLLGATIPEPPKDDNISPQVQKYLKTIYDELSRDNTETGLKLPSGAIFFMISGSCPTGTTDVSTTYSNKFLRVNATAGSTGGADTHTTPSHTLTTTEMPAHTHDVRTYSQGGPSGLIVAVALNAGGPWDIAGAALTTGGGGGHTHDAADNVPAFVTAKLCQID